MAQARTAPARATARPARQAAPRRAPLSVVRPDDRARTVGIMGTVFVVLVFTSLIGVAGLHAVLVQTQAEIDSIHAENGELEVERNRLLASQAWHDSPEGLEELAAAAGLVLAADVVMLAPVPVGALAAPTTVDPFARGGGG